MNATSADEPDAPEVIVAGAGPAGLMTALELSLRGVRTVVLDPLPEPDPRVPGMAINAACAELLDQRGLLDPIREDCFVVPGVHFSLIFLDMSEQAEPREDGYVVPQHTVSALIERRALAQGARIRRGHALIGLDQDAHGVTARVRDRTGGTYRLRADYLVGCDGRESTVRRLLGVGFPGTDDPGCRGLIGEVDIDPMTLPREHLGAYTTADGAVYTAAPVGPNLIRVTTTEYGRPAELNGRPATVAEFEESVLRVSRLPLRYRELRWVAAFSGATRLAERFADGRVFLVGDAAHVFYPTNGFGLSVGLGDAVNLGWKLAADLRRAGSALAAGYEPERRGAAERVAVVARAQGDLLHPPERAEPIREVLRQLLAFPDAHSYLIDVVSGLGTRYAPDGPAADRFPLLGSRLPPAPLTVAGEQTTVAGVLRPGHGVLLALGAAGAEQIASASGWSDRVQVVAAEPSPHIAADALLLRPDGHVAWVSTEAGPSGPLEHALTAWFGESAAVAA